MATLNGNGSYLVVDGVDLSSYWVEELSAKESADTEDITTGANATHINRAAKLLDNKLDFMIAADDTNFASYVQKLKAGLKGTVTWGPQGSTTGKPKFSGPMIITSSELSVSVDKKKHAFKLSLEGAGAPTHTITGGSTF